MDRTVTECIRENILADFLTRQRAEVKAMSIFEYDEAKERKLLQESYLEEGIEIGMERGIKQGMERGIAQGMERGIARGIEQGMEQGIKRGILTTLIDLVHEKVISVRDAARQAGLSEDEFSKQMLRYGAKNR